MKLLLVVGVLCLSGLCGPTMAMIGWPMRRGAYSFADFQGGHIRGVQRRANATSISRASGNAVPILKFVHEHPDHGAPPDRGMEMSDKKTKHHWGYGNPEAWGEMKGPEGKLEVCVKGKRQSPVNIDETMVEAGPGGERVKLSPLVHYTPLEGLKLKNNGHNCQVDADELGYFEMPDGKYRVHQFHFHFPSEHEVDGKLAAGEMHIVHQKEGAPDGFPPRELLVIGIMFDEGAENPFLKQLGFTAPMPADDTKVKIAGPVNVAKAFEKQLNGDFFRYEGSLTTPPCSETVKWFVLKERATASKAQIEAFKALYPSPSNNRPVQALHERKVVIDSLESGAQQGRAVALFGVPVLLFALLASLF